MKRIIYWAPRILCILLIIFLTIFSFDVFEEGVSFWSVMLAFLIHNIPVFILTIILVISWKKEIVGAVAFLLAGLAYLISMLIRAINNPVEWSVFYYSFIIAIPAFLISFLFFLNHKRK